MDITRKEFLGRLIQAAAGVAGVAVVVGCGSSASTTPDGGGQVSCLMNGTTYVIGGNHGHVLMVSKEDVAAGAEKTYDIMGTASHTHAVTVTAAMFVTLQANTSVMMTSTVGNSTHTHTVTVMCA